MIPRSSSGWHPSSSSGCRCRSSPSRPTPASPRSPTRSSRPLQLDGATGWQRLRYILLPMVRPVIMIVLLLNLIWDLRVFTQITMLQDAGPQASDYDLLGTYIYKQGVAGLNFGQGAAMAIFVLALTIADQLVLHPEPAQGGPGLMSTQTATAPGTAQRATASAKPIPKRRHGLGRPATWGWSILAIVIAIAWAFPVYWMVNSALLPDVDARVVHADLPAVRRLVRELPRGHRRELLRRAGHQPQRHAHRGVLLPRVRVPRRDRDQPVQVPRSHVVHHRDPAHPDASGRGPVRRAVQDDERARPAQQHLGSEPALHRGGRAVHDLDAARLRRRRARRARRSGDDRWAQPHPGVHADHASRCSHPGSSHPASSPSCSAGTSSPSRS